MADNNKYDDEMNKLSTLLLLAFGVGASESERMTALQTVPKCLVRLCLTAHDLVARIQQGGNEKLSAGEMQKVYDAAYAKGHADGAEQGRRSAVIAAAKPMGIIDTSDVGSGINGYDWMQIAQHLAAHEHMFSGKSLDFVREMPTKIALYGDPSPRRANWLRDLFMQKAGGSNNGKVH